MGQENKLFQKLFPLTWERVPRICHEGYAPAVPIPTKILDKKSKFTSDLSRDFIAYLILNRQALDKDIDAKRIPKIHKWFVARKELNQDKKNDLFFGCGYMLLYQMEYLDFGRPTNKFYNSTILGLAETDQITAKLFDKLINQILAYDKVNITEADLTASVNERKVILEKIKPLFEKFQIINFDRLRKHNQIATKEEFGQEICYYKGKLQKKYPEINIQIAKYLVMQIASSPLGQKNQRKTERRDEAINIKLASEKFLELASLFGVKLPNDLRKYL
jgi:hypothetical protein